MEKSFDDDKSENCVSRLCECGAEMEELCIGIDHGSYTEDWLCPKCGRLVEFHPDQDRFVVLSESKSISPSQE